MGRMAISGPDMYEHRAARSPQHINNSTRTKRGTQRPPSALRSAGADRPIPERREEIISAVWFVRLKPGRCSLSL